MMILHSCIIVIVGVVWFVCCGLSPIIDIITTLPILIQLYYVLLLCRCLLNTLDSDNYADFLLYITVDIISITAK